MLGEQTVSTTFGRETAKIYEFPRKFRSPGGEVRRGDKTVALFPAQPLPEIEFGSAWYHEAAVQEADRTRKP